MGSPFAYVALSFFSISPFPTMPELRSNLCAISKIGKVSSD